MILAQRRLVLDGWRLQVACKDEAGLYSGQQHEIILGTHRLWFWYPLNRRFW